MNTTKIKMASQMQAVNAIVVESVGARSSHYQRIPTILKAPLSPHHYCEADF